MLNRENLLFAIKKKPLVMNVCSMCGYECAFFYHGGIFGYDPGCDCRWSGWEPRDESELEFYLDPKNGWTEKLAEFIVS